MWHFRGWRQRVTHKLNRKCCCSDLLQLMWWQLYVLAAKKGEIKVVKEIKILKSWTRNNQVRTKFTWIKGKIWFLLICQIFFWKDWFVDHFDSFCLLLSGEYERIRLTNQFTLLNIHQGCVLKLLETPPMDCWSGAAIYWIFFNLLGKLNNYYKFTLV